MISKHLPFFHEMHCKKNMGEKNHNIGWIELNIITQKRYLQDWVHMVVETLDQIFCLGFNERFLFYDYIIVICHAMLKRKLNTFQLLTFSILGRVGVEPHFHRQVEVCAFHHNLSLLSLLFAGGGGLGDTTPAILAGTKRTENSFGIIWPSPRQLRVKNTLRVGHRGPVGRKTTQKPPQNTKKWKKIVKKRLFSRFGHFGQNSDFSRKKSKTGIFFDITKPPLAQIYPKSGL